MQVLLIILDGTGQSLRYRYWIVVIADDILSLKIFNTFNETQSVSYKNCMQVVVGLFGWGEGGGNVTKD